MTDNVMEKISVVFADDEQPAREKLAHQLSLLNNIEVVGVATTGKEAVDIINNLQPDLILLDIQMPEINGLELLSLLNYQPLIIYTTAYDEFAIQAFEQSSTDYLLKPYPLSRLKAAIDKAEQQLSNQRQLKKLTQENSFSLNKTSETKRLISKNGERIIILSPPELLYIKSEQGKCFASDGAKMHLLNETLDQLELSLQSEQFIRIHRSYLINIDKIKEIQRWFNGKLMIIMADENKTELSTSRAGAEKLKSVLGL